MTNSQNMHDGFQHKSQGTSENQANGLQQGPGSDHSSLEEPKGQTQSPNVLGLLGIMGIFAVQTYYAEKSLTRKPRNISKASNLT